MRSFFSRVLGFESLMLQLESRNALMTQQGITHAAQLAARDAALREAQSIVREREAVIREREAVVREREIAIESLKSRPPGADVWGEAAAIVRSGDLEAGIDAVLPLLEGWCSLRKALWLADLITGSNIRRIGEIGVFGGRSLIPMALAARGRPGAMVYAIEPWDNDVAIEHATNAGNDQWWHDVDLAGIKQKFCSAVLSCGLTEIVKTVELPSNDARIAFAAAAQKFDLLHIDGSHAEPQALADVMNWLPLVAPGGIIVLDDIGWKSVGKARDYLRAQCSIIEEVTETDQCSYGAYRTPGVLRALHAAQHEMA